MFSLSSFTSQLCLLSLLLLLFADSCQLSAVVHLSTAMDVKRHLTLNVCTLTSALGRDSGREVLSPKVMDPLKLDTPFIVEGDLELGGGCTLLAAPGMKEASEEPLSKLEQVGRAHGKNRKEWLTELVLKADDGASESQESTRSEQCRCGVADSSQHSHGDRFVQGGSLQCTKCMSSLKVAHECSAKGLPKHTEDLSLAIAQGACSLLISCICNTGELLALHQDNKAEFDLWISAQKSLALHEEDPSMPETGHASGVLVSTGFTEETTAAHIDGNNAAASHGGLPDHHVCVTKDPDIGFLVCLTVPNNQIQPVLVVQWEFATTFFCGDSSCHGGVHIGTCMNCFQHVCTMHNMHLNSESQKEWLDPLSTAFPCAFLHQIKFPHIAQDFGSSQGTGGESKVLWCCAWGWQRSSQNPQGSTCPDVHRAITCPCQHD